MALFGKREVIFKAAGDKERWKAAKEALKAASPSVKSQHKHAARRLRWAA